MAAALEPDGLAAAVHADVGARVRVVALVPAAAGVLVREVAAVVEAVAHALPGDAGAVLAAGRLFNRVVRFHSNNFLTSRTLCIDVKCKVC